MALSEPFMLAEYNAMYGLVKLHQDAVVGFFRVYLAILVVPFTAIAVIKQQTQIVWDKLSDFGIAVVAFILIAGVIIFRVCVEHQLKTILYVRCINSIRKFFASSATDDDKACLLFPITTAVPPFFKLGRDFFLESTLMAFLNSTLAGVVATNMFHAICAGIASFVLIGLLQLVWYHRVAERLEQKYRA